MKRHTKSCLSTFQYTQLLGTMSINLRMLLLFLKEINLNFDELIIWKNLFVLYFLSQSHFFSCVISHFWLRFHNYNENKTVTKNKQTLWYNKICVSRANMFSRFTYCTKSGYCTKEGARREKRSVRFSQWKKICPIFVCRIFIAWMTWQCALMSF